MWGFQIPSTSTIPDVFQMDWNAPCVALSGFSLCNDPARTAAQQKQDKWLYASLFERAALENRLTISNP